MPRIVVLRFAEETRVDLVDTDDEGAAIMDFVGRCLARNAPTIVSSGRRVSGPSALPLLEAVTVSVPPERIRALAGELPAPVVIEPIKRPVLSLIGLVASVRAFEKEQRGSDAHSAAAIDPLRSFLDHHDIDLIDVGCQLPPSAPTADQLFEALKHGDDRHRRWLREAIDAVYAGKPVLPPVEHGDLPGMKPPSPARVPTMAEIELMDRQV
jgi:hypothetical protein